MAKAYTKAEFDSLMEKVEKVHIRVKEYLELAGYEKWARFYAPVNRGWTMTSNIAESINAALVSARELPIYDFLVEVRKMFGRHILPLAYGVIDSENDAAWTWFFEQFKIAYGVRENMCIVSDRNESIIKSVSRVYPDVLHFACIWHLRNNVYKKFKKSHAKLSEIYFSMAKAYTEAEFDSLMEKVEKVDIRVKEYLEFAGYEKWARLYAPVNRGWTMTSNIAESINAALVSKRELPIYDFLEEVRKMFGRWNCSNYKEATQTYKTLGKKYQEMLELNERMCTRMTVVPSNEYLHTVNDGGRNCTVCLLERKCVCGRFQIDELPCPHAWAVLKSKFLMPEEYCSNYYKPSTIVMTYDVPVYTLPDKNDRNIPEHVAEEVVLPPKWKRPPGRPKKKRDKTLSRTAADPKKPTFM
ncbi:PREDICTED: uncharacterized protein LOC109221902 [Nicotiana attenuata]|uniref:uncharacterized protein LOC109221902 n=1 Tax=Nicotiana attenuata TaxID=49451 RepID=UPI000905098C|nr:PREDICTED: uncharacterized protein LOC109221902 [Nicotiana attenuata]